MRPHLGHAARDDDDGDGDGELHRNVVGAVQGADRALGDRLGYICKHRLGADMTDNASWDTDKIADVHGATVRFNGRIKRVFGARGAGPMPALDALVDLPDWKQALSERSAKWPMALRSRVHVAGSAAGKTSSGSRAPRSAQRRHRAVLGKNAGEENAAHAADTAAAAENGPVLRRGGSPALALEAYRTEMPPVLCRRASAAIARRLLTSHATHTDAFGLHPPPPPPTKH